MNLILLLFGVAVFLVYILTVYFRYGITSSISSSINCFTGLQKSYYSLFIVGISLPLMIVSNNTLGWWAGAFLLIDFAAPTTRDFRLQMFIHTLGADVGMGLGIIMLGVMYNLWPLVLIFVFFTFVSMRWKYKNHTWWIECFAFFIVMLGLFIEKL